MLSNFVSNVYARTLTHELRQNIVIRYHKRRSMFDRTTFNEDWIPRQVPYSKHRKPRQPEWSDPNTVFPVLIPPMYKPTMNYKHYVRTVIEKEEREKSLRSKEFILADIRAGDIVDITYQETFENEQKVTHRCLVLGFRRRNSFTAALEVAIRFGGMSLKAIYMINCPRVKNIQLVSKGSGNFRSNIKHDWKSLSKQQLLNPRIRKRVIKLRTSSQRRKKAKIIPAIKFD